MARQKMRVAVLREIKTDQELNDLEVVNTDKDNTIVEPFIHDDWRSKPRNTWPRNT